MNQTIDINTNKFKDYNLLICLLAYNINYIILLYYTIIYILLLLLLLIMLH